MNPLQGERFFDTVMELMQAKKLPRAINFQGEIKILYYLLLNDGNEVSPSEISRELKFTTARVATVLNSLEKKGLAMRTSSDFDHRKIIIKIPDKGREYLQEKKRELIRHFTNVLEYIGEKDSKNLIRIMEKFLRIIKSEGGESCLL